MSLLRVENLSLAVPTAHGGKDIIRDISFEIKRGEVLGLVGESGSGKSMIAKAIAGILPPNVKAVGGEVYFDGVDLLSLPERKMRSYRGSRISILFQDALGSLSPVMSVGAHLEEMYALHRPDVPSSDRKDAALELLRDSVHIPDAESKYRAIPGLLSGGQAQRVSIAMNALITTPDLLIVDEATTALDVTIQAQVLDLLFNVARDKDIAVLFITHDFGLIAEYTERVVVLDNGLVAERGSVEDIFERPQSRYVRNLLRDMPRMDKRLRGDFSPPSGEPVLKVKDLNVRFPVFGRKRFFLEAHIGDIRAVDGVDFSLQEGEILGIVGESGCGKTTIMRSLLDILPHKAARSGLIEFWGEGIDHMSEHTRRDLRRRVGAVAQNPAGSLPSVMRIRDIIAEGMEIHDLFRSRSSRDCDSEKTDRVRALMEDVGLDPGRMNDFTRRMSGGELQRVAIARALATNPNILILDEPTASLDASRKHTILELLLRLQKERDLSYILITHELPTVAAMCDRVAVMYLGRIVETGEPREVFGNPKHPYTRLLLSAMPIPDPRRAKERERIAMEGEVPSALNIPSGCRFRTRCPLADELCAQIEPQLEVKKPGHLAACHYSEKVQ